VTTGYGALERGSPTVGAAGLRVLRERRRRVWRSVLVMLTVSAVMVAVVVMNRDEAAIRSCAQRMEAARQVFQAQYDQGLPPPATLPLPTEGVDAAERRLMVQELQSHVYYDALFTRRRGTSPEVGVCCCREMHDRLIGPDGRHVLVFNTQTGKYVVLWLHEAEFDKRASELGLHVPGED